MADPTGSRLEGSVGETFADIAPPRAPRVRGITGSAKKKFGGATEDMGNRLGLATRNLGTFLAENAADRAFFA